jgi:acyl carrier protein
VVRAGRPPTKHERGGERGKDEMSDVKDRLRKFIQDEVLFGEGTVTDDQDLLGGVLDSLALLQFVEFVESEFGLEVGDADMVPDNFRTLDAVETYIVSRTS